MRGSENIYKLRGRGAPAFKNKAPGRLAEATVKKHVAKAPPNQLKSNFKPLSVFNCSEVLNQ